MPHKNRDWREHVPYHVMSRSNRKESLFKDEEDFRHFYNLLELANQKYPFQISSFVFMQTHFHLLMTSDKLQYSSIMQFVKKNYCIYFNRKYKLRGHLFDKRFLAKPAHSHRILLIMSRYIHYNPVEINIIKDPQDYKWSSYPLLLNANLEFNKNADVALPSFINFQPLLQSFTGTNNERRKKYIQWCTRGY